MITLQCCLSVFPEIETTTVLPTTPLPTTVAQTTTEHDTNGTTTQVTDFTTDTASDTSDQYLVTEPAASHTLITHRDNDSLFVGEYPYISTSKRYIFSVYL